MLISSRSNERVKEARSLRESKFRRATGLHFIEGDKLVGEALTSGAEVTTVFCREGTSAPRGGFELLEVTEGVMEALCTGTPQNLCALVRTPVTAPPEEYRGLIVVLEQLQDPGNVGTILRTADALGGQVCCFLRIRRIPLPPRPFGLPWVQHIICRSISGMCPQNLSV